MTEPTLFAATIDVCNPEWARIQALPALERQKAMDCVPLAFTIAHKVHQRLQHRIALQELLSAALSGLLVAVFRFDPAIHQFDPQRRMSFETYAGYRIRGAVLDRLGALSQGRR